MTSDWRREIDAAVDDAVERMIALRRHLHAHPEPSGEELQTSLHLYQLFDELGLAVRMGPEGCGVVVESRRQDGPRRIAVRADIDALRIQDQKQVPYRSTVPEVMHACGHDVHTATVFGALIGARPLGARRAAAVAGHVARHFSAGRGNERRRAGDGRGRGARGRRCDSFAARRSDAAGRHDRRAVGRVHGQLRCDARDRARAAAAMRPGRTSRTTRSPPRPS